MNAATHPKAETAIPAQAPPQPEGNAKARRKWFLVLGVLVVIAAIIYGVSVLLAPPSEETDDAYVAGDVIAVTARDPGTITAIYADNTQMVKKGQPLFDLDPTTADVGVASAEAELARSVRAFRAAGSQVTGGDAVVGQAQAELARAQSDLARRRSAAVEGAVSGEELAHAQDAVTVAAATLRSAQAQRAQSQTVVQGTDVWTNPAVLAAVAQYRRAAITRSHMHVVSPADGVVAQRTAQINQQIAAGTPLLSVVPLRKVWIDANFRETQLHDIRIGQPVTVTSDVYGGKTIFHGRVQGLGAGSGSAFALLPPQNASGNWIKIVQRLPVRIALDPKELDKMPLRIGLSVKAEVDTSNISGQLLGQPSRETYVDRTDTLNEAQVSARVRQIVNANMGSGR